MMLDLTDEEAAALVVLLRQRLESARYPYASRWDIVKTILAKLEPPKQRPEPLPPLKSGMGPAVGRTRLGRRG